MGGSGYQSNRCAKHFLVSDSNPENVLPGFVHLAHDRFPRAQGCFTVLQALDY